MFKPIKTRSIAELNQHIATKNPDWTAGVLEAANWLNDQGDISRNGYWMGDILLFKFNLITKRQLRKQKSMINATSDVKVKG